MSNAAPGPLILRLPKRREFPCPRCEHDLRGQALDSACPECGQSFLDVLNSPPAGYEQGLHRIERVWIWSIARSIGCRASAVHFARDALQRATLRRFSQVTARQVCEAMSELSQSIFKSPREAREMLSFWGVHRSEDVGRILHALEQHRLIPSIPGISLEAFNGLFVTERWMAD